MTITAITAGLSFDATGTAVEVGMSVVDINVVNDCDFTEVLVNLEDDVINGSKDVVINGSKDDVINDSEFEEDIIGSLKQAPL